MIMYARKMTKSENKEREDQERSLILKRAKRDIKVAFLKNKELKESILKKPC